jgi:NadR type nicotinamide-nucleotide adenylyltransferase
MTNKLRNIVITGPECTGKSTLAIDLARRYNTEYIPEYARIYIENLNRPYNYGDLELIAQRQINDFKEYQKKANRILFLDTYLIITKVWFDVVYNRCPAWIIQELQQHEIDLFLVCDTDIPWIPDNVRENGGEMREKLKSIYISEIEKFGYKYHLISGSGNQRLASAIDIIDNFVKFD